MLKDHKSAMHLEGVTFDKVIHNSNETEQFLYFRLFYNCQLGIMRFIHSFDNMFLLGMTKRRNQLDFAKSTFYNKISL